LSPDPSCFVFCFPGCNVLAHNFGIPITSHVIPFLCSPRATLCRIWAPLPRNTSVSAAPLLPALWVCFMWWGFLGQVNLERRCPRRWRSQRHGLLYRSCNLGVALSFIPCSIIPGLKGEPCNLLSNPTLFPLSFCLSRFSFLTFENEKYTLFSLKCGSATKPSSHTFSEVLRLAFFTYSHDFYIHVSRSMSRFNKWNEMKDAQTNFIFH